MSVHKSGLKSSLWPVTKNMDNLVSWLGLRQICVVYNCSKFNFWSDGKWVQITKYTYAKPTLKRKHSDCYVFGALFVKKILSVWQRNCHNALSHRYFSVYVWNESIFVAGSECGGSQCSCNRWSFWCNDSASSITGGLFGDRACGFCVFNCYARLIRKFIIAYFCLRYLLLAYYYYNNTILNIVLL